MTREEFLEAKFQEYYKTHWANHKAFFENPAIARVEPFKISDNIWYVGDKCVCIHLIDTGDGLILIDSGYIGAVQLLVDTIFRAGFDPKDVKWIIHSHGHYDHFGASNDFKHMYGTKLAISRVDGESVKECPKRAHMNDKLFPFAKIPEFDLLLEDGEVFELGNTRIRCVLTPGHTIGVMTFFINTTWEGKEYVAATFGGAGLGAVTLPHTFHYELPSNMPEIMLESIDKVFDERVDIQLGNHPGNNDTFGKREKQLREGGNPFISPSGNAWKSYLTALKKGVEEKIEENRRLEEEINSL